MPSPLRAFVLDEGHSASLDALAVSVALFGAGRIRLVYAPDRCELRRLAGELSAGDPAAPAVVVVDADHDRQPKSLLAEAADTAFPLAVLSDGRDRAIADHARSVAAAALLPTSLPARDLVERLVALAAPAGVGPG